MAILTLDSDQGPVVTSLDTSLQSAYSDGVFVSNGTPNTIDAIPGIDRLSAADLAAGRQGIEMGFAAFLAALRTAPTYYPILVFLNGFSQHPDPNYGAGSVRYRKDVLGHVHLDGLADTPGVPAGLSVFQLPVGYRPATGNIYLVAADGGTAKVQIMADGVVTVLAAPALTWMSFAGISFYAG